MAAIDDIRLRLIEALEHEGAAHGIDIVDVEVAGSSKAPVVRVRLDYVAPHADSISLDEVAAQNDWVSAVVEQLDPFAGSYTLEVSSPGLARPLRKASDFERFAGEEVALTTLAQEGRRRYTGKLLGMEGETIKLFCEGEELRIALSELRRCTINPTIDFSGKAKDQK